MDSRVTLRSKNRIAPMADLEKLNSHGRVEVLIAEEAWNSVVTVGAEIATRLGKSERLCIIGGDEQAVRRSQANDPEALLYSAKTVKGLEFSATVVVHPFAQRLSANSKLTPEQAMSLYTAVTRARERLLLVLSAREWKCLGEAKNRWTDAGVVEPIEAKGNTERILRDLLTRFTQHVSEAQRLELAVKNLLALAAGFYEDEAEWIEDIIHGAMQLLKLGGILELASNARAFHLIEKMSPRSFGEEASSIGATQITQSNSRLDHARRVFCRRRNH
jgi:hypothetical protein